MRLSELTTFLETRAPLSLQENYDNSGLIAGDPGQEITGAVVCLDSTEEVVDEAIRLGFNLIIAHHPIVFSGMKRFTGKTYVERTIIKAIRSGIAIYAIHTNLDNVRAGVNQRIAETLGLRNTRILSPVNGKLRKLAFFVPVAHGETVKSAVFSAGAGHIGAYDECSFEVEGMGGFRPLEGANPYTGNTGTRHREPELRVEVILPEWMSGQVVRALKESHPYEEVAFDLYPLSNQHQEAGSGMIGTLDSPTGTLAFLETIKSRMQCGVVRHTRIVKPEIRTVAVCGGSGSFLLRDAIAAGADLFVTSDFKYHEFFDAEGRIVIADIGHFESEQYTIDLIIDWLAEKFPTFATRKTGVLTNPVNYL